MEHSATVLTPVSMATVRNTRGILALMTDSSAMARSIVTERQTFVCPQGVLARMTEFSATAWKLAMKTEIYVFRQAILAEQPMICVPKITVNVASSGTR